MDAADEQAQQTAEQRKKQEKLQDEQEALADVRAKPVKVKDVAKVREVLAPTTVTQIEGTPSVTISATPEASDLGALSATIQGRLDAITDLPPGVTPRAAPPKTSGRRSTSWAWQCWWLSRWSS